MAKRSMIAARVSAMTAGLCLLLASGACSSGTAQQSATDATINESSAGRAVIFTPSDGITISQRTPLNKWAKLTPEITAQLVKQGVKKNAIETNTSGDIDAQSHDVQDWVVDHMTGNQSQGDADGDTTLIVAPAVESDSSTRQYGDYVTQPLPESTKSADSSSSSDATGSDASSSDDDASASDAKDAEQEHTIEQAYQRLESALRLAKESGMHVVLLSNGVGSFKPDAFVRFSTAEQIGRTQASKLVAKLDLAKASKDNPKAIEVMIPYSSDGKTGSDAAGDEDDDAFAREAFAGMWTVLEPYFSQGKAYSPSGLLTKDSTDADWQNVTVQATDEKHVAAALDDRLPTRKTDEGTSHTRIDGILAMNDYVASAVSDELDTLGYTGSAADINPSITIMGIVGNIAGKKDLQRGSVPDPAKAPEDSADTDESETTAQQGVDEVNSRWPIITGFGGYVDTMPQVVNGKQWMTGLEDRKSLASDTAEVVVKLNRAEAIGKLKYVSKQKIDGVKGKVNVVGEELLSVSATNLKTALIDSGYITMADAGL